MRRSSTRYRMGDDVELLLKVARMFYADGIPKTTIAATFGISNTQVHRLLQHARERGVVEITFHAPQLPHLAYELKRKYNFLREAVVIATAPSKDYRVQLKDWGVASAEYFETAVREGMRVGIGGGLTLLEMANGISEKRRDVHYYATAMIGRSPDWTNHVDPIVNVGLLWWKSGRLDGRQHSFSVTPYGVEGGRTIAEGLRSLRSIPFVQRAMRSLEDIDITFAGLGLMEVPKRAPILLRNQLTMRSLLEQMGVDTQTLIREGAVGDLNYSLFDEYGKSRVEWDFFLTPGLEFYRKMAADPRKTVMVIAGAHKINAIRAVLQGRLLNALLTDRETAENLLGFQKVAGAFKGLP
jgi:deoxyribonucleoside regulator